MIKKFCDRCGKEIVGEPWYMKWSQNSSSGASLFSDLCSRADAVSTYSNATAPSEGPMYCDECREAILAFAAKNPEQEEAEAEMTDGEALDAAAVLAEYCGNGDCDTCIFYKDGICMIAGEYFTLSEALALARDKFFKKNGGKK